MINGVAIVGCLLGAAILSTIRSSLPAGAEAAVVDGITLIRHFVSSRLGIVDMTLVHNFIVDNVNIWIHRND